MNQFDKTILTLEQKIEAMRNQLIRTYEGSLKEMPHNSLPTNSNVLTLQDRDSNISCLDEIVEKCFNFIAGRQTVLLLHGNANKVQNDKCSYIIQKLLKAPDIISIYIDLNNISKQQQPFLIPFLQNFFNFTTEQIDALKYQKNVVFIFDNYGNNGQKFNLHVTQQLAEWQGKSIILPDQKFFNNFINYRPCFVPYLHQKKQNHLFDELNLNLPIFNNKDKMKQNLQITSAQITSNNLFLFKAKTNQQFNLTTQSKSELPVLQPVTNVIYDRITALLKHSLNNKLLTLDINIMSLLADKVKQDKLFQDFLFEIIYLSKHDANLGIAAANAITILKYAKISFSKMDLSYINIPGADLSRAVLDTVNLQFANLQGVLFNGAWLYRVNFSNANLKNAYFGEENYISIKDDRISSCSYFPLDNLIIIANAEYLFLYDTNNRKKLHEFKGHSKNILTCTFSHDGQLVFSAGYDNTLRTWSIKEKELKYCWSYHKNAVKCLAVCRDSEIIVTGGNDGVIRFHNIKTGNIIKSLIGHTSAVLSMSFHPTDNFLLSAGNDNGLRLWDLHTNQCIHKFKEVDVTVNCVTFNNDGSLIAASADNGGVYIWAFTSKKLIFTQYKTGPVLCVAFSKDNLWIAASGSIDQSIHLWSIESQKCENVFESHSGWVKWLSFSKDGNHLLSRGDDNLIRWWNLTKNYFHELSYKQNGHTDWVNCLALSNNKKWIASASNDNTICLWSTKTGLQLYQWGRFTDHALCLAFSSCDKWLASGSFDGFIRIFSIEKYQMIKIINLHGTDVFCVTFSSDGKYFASSGGDKKIYIFEVTNGQFNYLKEIRASNDVVCLKFTPDCQHLASSDADGNIIFWSLITGQCDRSFHKHNNRIISMEFSPNGQYLLTTSVDNTIHLRSIKTGISEHIWEEEKMSMYRCFTYSPDGRYIVGGGWIDDFIFWDTYTKKSYEIYDEARIGLHSIIWLKNETGSYLITGGLDKTIRCWEIVINDQEPSCILTLCWTNTQNLLVVADALLNEKTLIDESNYNLLLQYGAIDTSKKNEENNNPPDFQPNLR